ncbi:Os04g0346501 [Oryza sativa Japonica Group]|uniref:Os04g0346501 protein n=1 Tax=Oryza sativa subsp. japonica TaxID=39947 RepID=A0A0P0W8R7_ORYSJ|nr:Os04g0346501 [Oryza sativa Japonica Group]
MAKPSAAGQNPPPLAKFGQPKITGQPWAPHRFPLPPSPSALLYDGAGGHDLDAATDAGAVHLEPTPKRHHHRRGRQLLSPSSAPSPSTAVVPEVAVAVIGLLRRQPLAA